MAVAEELNFTRAAERLHLSQPALSKQIRGLETTLRAQLFRRDHRQVELTAAGTALHAVARDLLRDWDDGVAMVGDAAAEDTRVLRVGTLTSIGRGLYPAITDQFAKRQPDWRVELHSYGWGDPTAGPDEVPDRRPAVAAPPGDREPGWFEAADRDADDPLARVNAGVTLGEQGDGRSG